MTHLAKKGLVLMALSMLLLSACGAKREEARFDAFRKTLADAAVTVTAEVTARDGDEATTFTLRCAEAQEGCDIEVLAPQEIAGVRAHVDANNVEMRFDDLILPMPQNKDAVSPLMALPLVLEAARTGHLDLVWEEDALVCQLIARDNVAVRLYLNADGTPTAAEIDMDGHTNVFCTVTEWSTAQNEVHNSDQTVQE